MQQTSAKRMYDETWVVGEGDILRIVKEILPILSNGICILENEMHKILWDFEIQTDHLIPAWRLDLVVVNTHTHKKKKEKKKVNLPVSGLCRPGGPLSENQRKRKERGVLTPCKRTKKAMKHEGDCDCNFNWRARNDLQKVTGRERNRRTRRDHLNVNIIEIGQKTGKSPGDSDSNENPSANAGVEI